MLSFNRNSIFGEDFEFSKVTDFSEFKDFDCGKDDPLCGKENGDLNDFIINDAEKHRAHLIAEIYSFRFKEGDRISLPVAFIALQNDVIGRTKLAKRVLKKIPYGLRYSCFPAVKIGRLGVQKDYQRSNVGTELVNIVKEIFTTENRTGCRFITLDAYNNPRVIGFYRKNGFDFYCDDDVNEDTRIMFFDLRTFVPSKDQQRQVL